MTVEISMNKEEYEQFIRCLSIIKDICNDADVVDGIIRQRTNDSANVFEIDMRPLIDGVNLPLMQIKQKIDILKMFMNEEVTVTVDDDGSFTFQDQYSVIKFENVERDFMDNRYITEEELNGIFTLNEEDVILGTNIQQKISDRMKILSINFNVNAAQVIFNDEIAHISMETQGRDQVAKVVSDITVEQPMECSSSLVITPFTVDHDGDIEFKMYNYQEQICSNKFSTSIADVEINIYGRSQLVEE